MSRLFQINVACNWGSHGRIAEELGRLVQAKGWESCIAYGRYANSSTSKLVKIGNRWDVCVHGVKSLLLDNHGLNSAAVTMRLIKSIEEYNPDLIHLHNIHGYYLNYPLLFDFLSKSRAPVVWTLHDCWPFTGHCSHPVYAQCEKWKTACSECPSLRTYPRSIWKDRSAKNFQQRKQSFNAVENLTLVSVSKWLDGEVAQSFLGHHRHLYIYNGVDTQVFTPMEDDGAKDNTEYLILGVANVWYAEKGLNDFIKLRALLPQNYKILLVGLNQSQQKQMPEGILGKGRTDNVQQLAELYAKADVFVNPSLAETFGLTTAEALSCGTPAVVYDTTACPELVTEETGRVVRLGDIKGLAEAVKDLCNRNEKESMRHYCRERALKLFDKQDRYQQYWDLYQSVLKEGSK